MPYRLVAHVESSTGYNVLTKPLPWELIVKKLFQVCSQVALVRIKDYSIWSPLPPSVLAWPRSVRYTVCMCACFFVCWRWLRFSILIRVFLGFSFGVFTSVKWRIVGGEDSVFDSKVALVCINGTWNANDRHGGHLVYTEMTVDTGPHRTRKWLSLSNPTYLSFITCRRHYFGMPTACSRLGPFWTSKCLGSADLETEVDRDSSKTY